jgi:quercetin dioxygenase-like cupin family protein
MSEVFVIRRADVPAIYEVEENGTKHDLGEHRDFSRHPTLRQFIPNPARLAISWAFLEPGQTLEPHLHPIRSMIVVCRGSGRLLGDKTSALEEGDIVAVGPGRLHGFVGGEPHGLQVLSIQFEERGLYEDAERALVNFPKAPGSGS